MKPVQTVGILGLGKMGCPIAAHLVAKGFKVVGYDPLEEALNQAVALGARAAASAREAARASDLVIVVVGFDSEVEEVLFGREGVLEGARPGLIVALGSTVAPRYSRRLAARLAENWAMDTRAERSGMPWAEKDMSIVLEEADRARLSLPLAGTVKEAIKGLKIRMGLGMPEIPERL